MMIATGNLKGGCGCTTVLLLLAHHLSLDGKKVYLIDLSTNGALNLLYHRSMLLLENLPFEFFRSDERSAQVLVEKLKQDQAILLIDMPKTLVSKKLQDILVKVDCFIIPFQYTLLSLHAASAFSLLSAKFSKDSRQIFLPNNNFAGDFSGELWVQQESLRSIGKLSSAIPAVAPLINLRSMSISPAALFQLDPTLRLLCGQYLFNSNLNP
ncbi:MAG: hypothetical protein EOO20_21780 [Chryseobacterium sp.]|nr:MAG: hypothetical protein EOO20_21780 [Chryseobacterium sp.]